MVARATPVGAPLESGRHVVRARTRSSPEAARSNSTGSRMSSIIPSVIAGAAAEFRGRMLRPRDRAVNARWAV
jgi:hypothetical protein